MRIYIDESNSDEMVEIMKDLKGEIKTIYGNSLSEVMEKQGISNTELANALHISVRTIQRLKAKATLNNVPMDELEEIADALDVEVSSIAVKYKKKYLLDSYGFYHDVLNELMIRNEDIPFFDTIRHIIFGEDEMRQWLTDGTLPTEGEYKDYIKDLVQQHSEAEIKRRFNHIGVKASDRAVKQWRERIENDIDVFNAWTNIDLGYWTVRDKGVADTLKEAVTAGYLEIMADILSDNEAIRANYIRSWTDSMEYVR